MSQRNQKQTKQSKTTPKIEKPFSPTTITNFFNNYYRNVAMKTPTEQNLSFKVAPTEDKEQKSQQSIINLYDYQGLQDFIQTYKLVLKQCEESQEPDESKKHAIEKTIDITFDMKLRACLDNARTYKTNDKTKINTFQEFIIPQLGFDTSRLMNISDYIKGINSYFTNESKLKTKIYNLIFPHASHNPDKLPAGVNIIYLQHVSKYHDEILELVINKELSEEEVLTEVQKLYASDYVLPEKEDDKKLTKQERMAKINNVKLQLLNPEIINYIMNPPMIETKSGKQIISLKWIDDLKVVKRTGKNITQTTENLSNEEKRAIRALNRELMIVKSFVKIILGAKTARKIEMKGDEQVIVPMNVDLKQYLTKYKETYKHVMEFYNEWNEKIKSEMERIEAEKEAGKLVVEDAEGKTAEQIIAENVERQQYELFLRYFIETVRFIKTEFKYNQPLKAFINDVKKDAVFKFNKVLHGEIEKLIKAEVLDDEKIKELATIHAKDWKYINFPKSYDPNDLNIYGKIGKICGLDIHKEYRIAIGISLVAFIQERIALIRAANRRKRDIQIYIKM